MSWKLAPTIKAAFTEANKKWPGRSKLSDGTIGDTAHSNRKSDHNPDASGVVHAFDLTHDPSSGVDCNRLSKMLVSRKDTRVKYIIWNSKICKSDTWIWKPYTGSNKHTKHMHVSIKSGAVAENDTRSWWEHVALKVSFSIYYVKPTKLKPGEAPEDFAFKRAATTFMASTNNCFLEQVTTGIQFKNLWNRILKRCDDNFWEIKSMAIFSHASKGEALDGIEFKSSDEEDGTITQQEIAKLPLLPWAKDACLTLHSCNSGLKKKRGWCPAESMNKRQKVTTVGMSGYSYFSKDATRMVPISKTDQRIFLWAFNRGKNNRTNEVGYKTGVTHAYKLPAITYR